MALKVGAGGVVSLARAQYAPTLTAHDPNPPLPLEGSASVSVTPGILALVLVGFAPTVTVSGGGVTVTPPAASLALTGYAPAAVVNTIVTPAPVGGSGTWPTGRTLALDFSDTGTLTLSGALISQVDDQSGNNYDFTQTGDSRPTSEVDGVLGQAATFTADGSTDDWMESTATVANVTNASAWTIAARIRVASITSALAATYGDGVLFPYGSSGPGIHLRSDCAGDDRAYAINEDGGWPPDECYVAIDLDTELILVAKLEGGTLSIQIGTGTPATTTSGNVTATTETWRIGYAPGGGAWFDGAMSHVMAWDRALSSGEISTTVAILGGTAGPALTAYAPTVRLDKIAIPPAASLTLTGYAPTVTGSGGGVAVTPPTAALSLTGYAPTIARAVTPPTGSLTLASSAPTVLAPRVVVPSVGALTAATLAPTVVASANVSVTPATASLDLASFAPTVLAPRIAVPTTTSLTLAAFAPTIVNPKSATPPTATLTTTGYAPTVTVNAGIVVTPSTASLATATFAPTVLAPRVAVPSTLVLTTTSYAPVIARIVVPTTASLALASFAPSALAPRVAVPSTATLALTGYAPTIGGAATAVPATATLTTASYNPTVLAPRVVVPAPVALSLDGFAPTITAAAGALAVPSPAALTLTEYAPTVTSSGSRAYTPTTLAVAITSYLPIVTTAEPPPMRMRAMRDRNLLPMPRRLWRPLIRKD